MPVNAQVDEVKGIMTENIDKMLQRGEKLELLTDKTENLMFEVRSRILVTCVGWIECAWVYCVHVLDPCKCHATVSAWHCCSLLRGRGNITQYTHITALPQLVVQRFARFARFATIGFT